MREPLPSAASIAAMLHGQRTGGSWLVRCPVPSHGQGKGDRNPSLMISDGREALLVKCLGGCDSRDVISELRIITSTGEVPEPPKTPEPQQHQFDRLSYWGDRIWRECLTITEDDPAGRYLLARGCTLPPGDGDLRWHPQLPHKPAERRGPALVGLVTSAQDASLRLSLHRTWISRDGSGRKADFGADASGRPYPNRMLLARHPKRGGVIRLWPDEDVTTHLGLAEGIETALTLALLGIPVFSALSAGNLADLPYMAGIETLFVAVDNDAPQQTRMGARTGAGPAALNAIARRWTAASGGGCCVRIERPRKIGVDLNDVAQRAV